KFLLRPKGVIPTAAGDPFAFLMLSDALGQTLLQFGNTLCAIQTNRKPVLARSTNMHVRIIESRHRKMFLEVHHSRAFVRKARDLIVIANGQDVFASYQHGFSPWRRRIVRVDAPLTIDREA